MTALLSGPVVAEVMLHRVKELRADAEVADAAALLENDHVHLVVVVDADRRVVTAITRAHLAGASPHDRAADLGTLEGRRVRPDAPLDEAREHMLRHGLRRLVVVGPDDRLHGLLCLKRHRRGFCGDHDVRDRAADRDR